MILLIGLDLEDGKGEDGSSWKRKVQSKSDEEFGRFDIYVLIFLFPPLPICHSRFIHSIPISTTNKLLLPHTPTLSLSLSY